MSTEKEAVNKPRRHRTLFKTLNARVNFVIVATSASFIAVGAYALIGAKRLNHDFFTAAAVSVALIFVITWLMLVIGDLLVSRRARRLAHTMLDIVNRTKPPEELPAGLAEFDELTGLFSRLAEDLHRTRETMEEQVKSRTSLLELNQGLTELQRARIEALLASIGEGVVAADRDGKISFINDVARKTLWWKAPEVTDVPIHAAFRLEDEKENTVAQEKWPTLEAIAAGRTVNTSAPARPYYLRRQDMSRLPVRMTISPVKLAGDVVGTVTVFGDITKEVEFDKAKSEFISIASHQLRSPSSAIRMMADLMRKGDFGALNDTQKQWTDKLFVASDSLVTLVNELLNVSRLEAGLKMERTETDPAAFVENVLKLTEPWLLEKQQKFVFAKPALPMISFDNVMIGEVLKNLVSNAAKYSPAGAAIAVSAEADGDSVRFAVTDSGIGIPASNREKMFNKFFRADNAAKSSVKGTGLGLYYCKTAVEKHGGKIGFDSTEGQGSTFWFTLPVKPPPAQQ